MTEFRSKYIPEIDGLRALAVLGVILFHLQVSSLPGGFVGVDVFFVISGYLITAGLNRELSSRGTLGLGNFYLRRARRLVPALYAVLLVSGVVAFAVLSHHRLMQYGASQVAAALSISNIHFFLGSGYFDTTSDYKPLLHTWSLGVEEQFYLIWPCMVWVAWRSGHRLFTLCGLVFAASLFWAIWLVHSEPSATFYLVPFRMYEFVIGAALALRANRSVVSSGVADGALVGGLLLVLGSMAVFGPHTPFPGGWALLPCLGAGLVLWSIPFSRVASVLRLPVLGYLGRASYSSYLVHWPLIVLYRVAKGREHLRPGEQAALLLLTMLLAHFLHRHVENRYRVAGSNRRFLRGVSIVTIMLLGTGAAMQIDSWVQARSWASSNVTPNEVKYRRKERFVVRQRVCEAKGWDHCDDLVAGRRNGLIIGDSHAVDAYNAFVSRFPADNFALSDLGGCPPYRAIQDIVLAGHPDIEKCVELNRHRHDPDFLKKFDYVVINVYRDWYREEHLVEYLEFLRAQGLRHVVVLGQTWRAPDDVPELVNRVGFAHDKLMSMLTPPPSDRMVKEACQRLGFMFIDKTDALSTGESFDVFDAGEVLFTYDQHHLSLPHAKRLLDRRLSDVVKYLDAQP